jgi:hypothetical protein
LGARRFLDLLTVVRTSSCGKNTIRRTAAILNIFDGHVWIDAMLIENSYDTSLEAFE